MPENTIVAIAHGVAVGADWQEVDVGLCADDRCVVLHDDTLERTTTGTGLAQDHALDTLMQMGAGRPTWDPQVREVLAGLGVPSTPDFGDTYADVRVPSLAQILAVPGARLMLELKTTAKPEVLVQAVLDEIASAQCANRVAWGSFDVALVAVMQRLGPQIPRIGICENAALLPHLVGLGVRALAVDVALLPSALAAAQAAPSDTSVAVWVWTVYTEAVAKQLAADGADGLIADIPKALVAARAAGRLPRPAPALRPPD